MGILGRLIIVTSTILGAGCQTEDAQPYSPNYRIVPVNADAHQRHRGKISKDYDAKVETTLVPDACITPDTAEQALYLPSGCASNLNLQLMAYRKQDLLRGREMGPAMAEPVARAARIYIDGNQSQSTARPASDLDIDAVRQ